MGAEKISELLPDYDAFIRESLPEEVQAREDAGFTLPEGSGEICDAAHALYGPSAPAEWISRVIDYDLGL